MKKGFTLLELVVVIIIIGILATLGIQQYGSMVERSRGAEARTILGQLRTAAAAVYLQKGNTLSNIVDADIGIGTGDDQIPSACRSSHYFSYMIVGGNTTNTMIELRATRCAANGKTPNAAANTLVLDSYMVGGGDTWTSTYGY